MVVVDCKWCPSPLAFELRSMVDGALVGNIFSLDLQIHGSCISFSFFVLVDDV